jgi:hypothetical protein
VVVAGTLAEVQPGPSFRAEASRLVLTDRLGLIDAGAQLLVEQGDGMRSSGLSDREHLKGEEALPAHRASVFGSHDSAAGGPATISEKTNSVLPR